jgi:hypothetical protein
MESSTATASKVEIKEEDSKATLPAAASTSEVDQNPAAAGPPQEIATKEHASARDLLPTVDLHPHLGQALKREQDQTASGDPSGEQEKSIPSQSREQSVEPQIRESMQEETKKLKHDFLLVCPVAQQIQAAYAHVASHHGITPPQLLLTRRQSTAWTGITQMNDVKVKGTSVGTRGEPAVGHPIDLTRHRKRSRSKKRRSRQSPPRKRGRAERSAERENSAPARRTPPTRNGRAERSASIKRSAPSNIDGDAEPQDEDVLLSHLV